MVQGLIIIADLKEKDESGKRLFRKKRLQMEKRTGLKRLKNGVYLFPIMNPKKITDDELRAFDKVKDVMDEYSDNATYFVATQVDPIDGWTLPKTNKIYFVLRPIRKLVFPK